MLLKKNRFTKFIFFPFYHQQNILTYKRAYRPHILSMISIVLCTDLSISAIFFEFDKTLRNNYFTCFFDILYVNDIVFFVFDVKWKISRNHQIFFRLRNAPLLQWILTFLCLLKPLIRKRLSWRGQILLS